MSRSPGVFTSEDEVGTVIPQGGVGTTATVGRFRWGPAFDIVAVADPTDLLDTFKAPDRKHAYSFVSTEILSRASNDVRTVRAVDEETARNSVPSFGVIVPVITTPGTGYSLGDVLSVEVDAAEVTTGEITQIGANGEIEDVSITPFTGTLEDAVVTITSSGGTGGEISVSRADESTVTILNDDDAESKLSEIELRDIHNAMGIPAIFGRYPGAYGNRIIVDVVSFEDFVQGDVPVTNRVTGDTTDVDFSAELDFTPSKSGQYGIIVRDQSEVVLATTVSVNEGDRNVFGQSILLNDMASDGRLGVITASGDFGWSTESTGRYELGGGSDGEVNAAMFLNGWDSLEDESNNPAQVMSTGPTNGEDVSIAATVAAYARELCEFRGTAIATLGTPPQLIAGLNANDAVDAEIEYRTGLDNSGEQVTPNIAGNYKRGSYHTNCKWTYDRFNDRYFWMDTASDKAARIINVLSQGTPWQSAAGTEFGVLSGVRKLAYNPKRGQRTRLYAVGANPVVLNNGVFYFRGDKTMFAEPSSFSRENVVQLFNSMKTDITQRAEQLEFQQNTPSVQRQYKNESDAYMRTLQSRGGIEDFRNFVAELNTADVRARNEFRARHGVKPVSSINFVILQFTSVGPNVDFEELEG